MYDNRHRGVFFWEGFALNNNPTETIKIWYFLIYLTALSLKKNNQTKQQQLIPYY